MQLLSRNRWITRSRFRVRPSRYAYGMLASAKRARILVRKVVN